MSGYWLVVREEKADAGRAAGHRRGVEDAAGDRTTFAYDGGNRLVPVKDAAGAVTTCTYNARQERIGQDVASMPLNLLLRVWWPSGLLGWSLARWYECGRTVGAPIASMP